MKKVEIELSKKQNNKTTRKNEIEIIDAEYFKTFIPLYFLSAKCFAEEALIPKSTKSKRKETMVSKKLNLPNNSGLMKFEIKINAETLIKTEIDFEKRFHFIFSLIIDKLL